MVLKIIKMSMADEHQTFFSPLFMLIVPPCLSSALKITTFQITPDALGIRGSQKETP